MDTVLYTVLWMKTALLHDNVLYKQGRIYTKRGPRLFLFFPLKIGEDQKKGRYVHKCSVFTENIGEDQKQKSLLFIVHKAPHFLRSPPFSPRPRLQPVLLLLRKKHNWLFTRRCS